MYLHIDYMQMVRIVMDFRVCTYYTLLQGNVCIVAVHVNDTVASRELLESSPLATADYYKNGL